MKAKHKSLLHASLEIIAGRGFVAIISLLFIAFFARELPKPILGLIGVHAAITALSKVVLDLGMHFQVVREATPLIDANRLPDAVDKIIRPAVTIRFFFATALAILLLATGYFFMDDLQAAAPEIDMYLVIPFACAHILLKNYQHILTPVFHANQRYWQDSLIDSGSATSEKLCAFLFYIAFGIDYLFAGVMVGVAITLILGIWLLRDVAAHFRPRRLPAAEMLQWLRICFPNYQRVLYRRGFKQLDRVVIASLLPLAQMANYHIARQGAQVLGQLARIFSGPVTVRLAADLDSGSHERDRRLYYSSFIVLSLVMAGLSPWFVTLIGGENYSDAWVIMAILSIGFMFNGLAEYQLSVIAVKGDSDTPIAWERIAGIAGLVTTVVMIYWIGQNGAPMGQLVNFMLLYFLGRSVVRQILLNR
jgi:O-antigen/teichoic acid export membrane protein